MRFYKYHGLGNDYIVLDPLEFGDQINEDQILRICHRHCGIGSDGILFGPFTGEHSELAVRIFNPDGSEAEKSGNGLRIFARYLYDRGRVTDEPFVIETLGGNVTAKVSDNGRIVSVDMGTISFESNRIPVTGSSREVIGETIEVEGESLPFCAANIGNPHCVIIKEEISPAETRRLGPSIERHVMFPNRINVQFAKVLDRANIAIEIWERGAGYTLASGSSASASAAVAHRLGLCDGNITVHMPGGKLDIRVNADYSISLTGPVAQIADGRMKEELFSQPLIG